MDQDRLTDPLTLIAATIANSQARDGAVVFDRLVELLGVRGERRRALVLRQAAVDVWVVVREMQAEAQTEDSNAS